MIAMALSCNPALLVADEPTTALDVTVQAQILDLVRKLQKNHGSAIVFITHDMGVMAEIADRVMVMYAGRVVERGTKRDLFLEPRHPYTRALLDSIPPLSGRKAPAAPRNSRHRRPICSIDRQAAPLRRAACSDSTDAARSLPLIGEAHAAACFRVNS